jgi:pimeloyl-ACP methyl ester carboxylesterase
MRANEIAIEYESFGPENGVPLLLIHGFAQQSVAWPDEFVEGFARAGMRVIVYDNRDTGFSRKFDGQIPDLSAISADMRAGRKPDVPYTLDDMAADAAGLLDALGIESAHVAGASMGGMIAQLVALNHTAKTRSLTVIFSTTGDAGLPPSSRESHLALVTPPAGQDRASVIAHVLKNRLAYSSTGFPLDDERAALLIGRAYDRMYYPEGGLRHMSAVLSAPPRGERLRSLKLPALVLHGSADTLLPPAHGRSIADAIPGAEYHEIAGWGHDLPAGVIPLLHGLMLPFIGGVERTRG